MNLLLFESTAMHVIGIVIIFFFLNFVFEAFDFFFVPVLQIFFSMCMPLLVSIVVFFIMSLAIKKGSFVRSAFNWALRIFALLICFVVFAISYVEIPFKELVQYGKWAFGFAVLVYFILRSYIIIKNSN